MELMLKLLEQVREAEEDMEEVTPLPMTPEKMLPTTENGPRTRDLGPPPTLWGGKILQTVEPLHGAEEKEREPRTRWLTSAETSSAAEDSMDTQFQTWSWEDLTTMWVDEKDEDSFI